MGREASFYRGQGPDSLPDGNRESRDQRWGLERDRIWNTADAGTEPCREADPVSDRRNTATGNSRK